MENPMNSLIAMHPRYTWMVEHLLQIGVHVPYHPCWRGFAGMANENRTPCMILKYGSCYLSCDIICSLVEGFHSII